MFSAGRIRIFSNGKRVTTVSNVPAQTPNTDPVTIGKRDYPSGTKGYLNGDLAELMVFGAALDGGERRRVEQYLRGKYSIAERTDPTLAITRVIPGPHEVTVHWRRPERLKDAADVRCRVEAKFRGAAWNNAVSMVVSNEALSATVTGLLDHADYTIRVTAEGGTVREQLAVSAERLVRPGAVPGVVIDYLHKDDGTYFERGRYIGSPSIARLPDGGLVASHDLFGSGTTDLTRMFRSDDGGASWRHTADVDGAFWGKLFVHEAALYLLACSRRFGDLVLHRSGDGGATWQTPVVLAEGTYHKAPMPVLTHNGRLWTCIELKQGRWAAEYAAVVLSAPVDADLMDPRAWRFSAPLPYDPAWRPPDITVAQGADGLLEGNAVVGPQGRLLNVLRYHIAPSFGKALVLSIAADGTALTFDRVIDFYGGMTKFTIRRHPETGVYWSLVNRVTAPQQPAMRNVLTLVRSRDLDSWTLVRDVLRDDNETAPRYVGFQYVDWLFDGNDIIAVSRTAFNGARNYHDANHLTFHRVRDFAHGPRRFGP